MKLKPTYCPAFVMDKMPFEKEWKLRIVIPGIDNGGAVYLEATSELKDQQSAEDLLDLILAALPNVKRERPNPFTRLQPFTFSTASTNGSPKTDSCNLNGLV
jgi:hypothetical protein